MMTLLKVYCANSGCPWNTGDRCCAERLYVNKDGVCETQWEQ